MSVARDAARTVADAVRSAGERSRARRGPGRYRATVLDTDPLRVELHGTDLELDADEVALGKTVVAAGVETGDVLVLVDVGEHDYVAVDIEET